MIRVEVLFWVVAVLSVAAAAASLRDPAGTRAWKLTAYLAVALVCVAVGVYLAAP